MCSQNQLIEAFVCFSQVQRLRFAHLTNTRHLNEVRSRLLQQQHIRVLNDEQHSAVFHGAIQRAVTAAGADCTVLDIGTGTGLLSLFAAEAGASAIVACDDSPLMLSIARETFKTAGVVDRVRLLNRRSTDLTPADTGGRPVDVIVTDMLDSSCFGDGLLQSLIHAKRHLLRPDGGRILPARATFYMAGFESQSVAQDTFCMNQEFEDLIYLKGHRLVSALSDSGHETVNIRHLKDIKFVTKVEEVFSCNFNDANDMQAILDGSKVQRAALPFRQASGGQLDGFVMWFGLSVDEDNGLFTDPAVRSCRDQMLFKLNHRFANREELQCLNVRVSCPDGVWRVQHYYDFNGRVLAVGPSVIRFLNDREYLHKLEFDFFSPRQPADETKAPEPEGCRLSYENILDFSPFPYIGISMLKERRASRVYCSTASERLVRFVAAHNCLSPEQIVFIDDPADVLHVPHTFDVIILDLIDTQGRVNAAHVSNYAQLRASKLRPGGRMMPHKIDVWCRVIRSDWISQQKTVTNRRLLANDKVVHLIQSLATDHLSNLLHFEHTNLSNAFLCAELQLDGSSHERLVRVPMGEAAATLNGIQYWYEIAFASDTPTISTIRYSSSYIRRACFVADARDTRMRDGCAAVRFIQDRGALKITNYVHDLTHLARAANETK